MRQLKKLKNSTIKIKNFLQFIKESEERVPTKLTDENTFEMFSGTGVYQALPIRSLILKNKEKNT